MNILFKKLRFKNVLSFGGNQVIEIDFLKGLNLINGTNGNGKSTILDALYYAFYGKPFRNIKIEDLVNRYVGKAMWAEVTFQKENDEYVIERGVKPKVLNIRKNGNDLELMSTSKLIQDEIDKIIGIDDKMFKNQVGIATISNKPFLSMGIADRRAVEEKFFNIDVIGYMVKDVKKRNSNNKTLISLNESQLNGVKEQLDDVNRYIADGEKQIKEFESNRQETIKRNEEQIEQLKNTLDEKRNFFNADKEKKTEYWKKEIAGLENSIKTERETFESNKATEVKSFNDKISNIESAIATKKKAFADEVNGKIDEYNASIESNNAEIEKHNKNVKIGNDKIEEIKAIINGYGVDRPSRSDLEMTSNNISVLQHDIDKNTKLLEKLANYSVCPVCSSPMDGEHAKKHLAEIRQQIASDEKTLAEKSESLEKMKEIIESCEHNETIITKITDKVNKEYDTIAMLEKQNKFYADQVASQKSRTLDFSAEMGIIKSLKEKIAEVEKSVYDESKNQYHLNQFKQNLEDVMGMTFDGSTIENTISSCMENIETAKNSVCKYSVDEFKKKSAELTKSYEELDKEHTKIQEQINLDNDLTEILGDDGLKKHFFKNLLPVFNERIGHYLNRFGLDISLEFDDTMTEHISQGQFTDLPYYGFSNGERTRIDMAILLSFYTIAKLISNWSCSLLFIDEVMDGGVDSAGIEQFISVLYNVVNEEANSNMGVYLISHKLADIQVKWDSVINITKNGMFSKMEISK